MTDYKMTDEWRKLLTEKLLGECWHEWELTRRENHKCKHCGYISFRDFFPSQRSFTTDTAMLAVFKKIGMRGSGKSFTTTLGINSFLQFQPLAFVITAMSFPNGFSSTTPNAPAVWRQCSWRNRDDRQTRLDESVLWN